jgi:heme exporter protein CcmB
MPHRPPFTEIALDGVGRHFGRRRVLADVNFKCRAGEIVGLLGPNGSGKTTLLSIVATLALPSSGRVSYGSFDASRDGPVVRAHLGLLAHEPFLYPDLTARENLRFFGRLYAHEAVDARVEASLNAARLAERGNDRVAGLSRGMQQRLAFERALVHDPVFLLLDEPFSGLDDRSMALMVERLMALREHGVGIVVATHDLETVSPILTRAVILDTGRATVIENPGSTLREAYTRLTRGAPDLESHSRVRLTASAVATAVRRSFTRRRKPDTTYDTEYDKPVEEADDALDTTSLESSELADFWRVARAVFVKDVLVEARSREIAVTTIFFALASVLMFAFGFVADGQPVVGASAAILWIALAFSGTLALGRVYARERTNESLHGLLLAPAPRAAIYIGKLAGVVALMFAVAIVLVPLVVVFFRLSTRHPWLLAGLVALGILGFASVGTVFAAMLSRARSREALLPIALYPMTVPVLIAGVRGTATLIDPEGEVAVAQLWFAMLLLFDVVFVLLALWTFEAVVAE